MGKVSFIRSWWFPILLGISIIIFFLQDSLPAATKIKAFHQQYREGDEWMAPSENEIPINEDGELIRYGKELIENTSRYLGPSGNIAQISNGMNCQNCHTYAGTQNFANPFSAV